MRRRHLFAYGTLMCPEIFRRLTARRPLAQTADLSGYHCSLLRGEHYPAIVPAAAGRVTGLFYPDLPEVVWKILDAYEGREYDCKPVTVALAAGGSRAAYTYVIAPGYRHRLSDRPWCYERFLSSGKRYFMARYPGFRRRHL